MIKFKTLDLKKRDKLLSPYRINHQTESLQNCIINETFLNFFLFFLFCLHLSLDFENW